ncbi:MAG TPA: hypothetical protein VNY36_01690, partial [Bacteroidia bacterium]|nr:hypothetical protein [Bacteroidia bacterium]
MKTLKPLVKIALACCLSWFTFGNLEAGDIHVTQRIEAGLNSCPTIVGGISPCDIDTVSLTPMTGSFRDYNVQDILTLGIDHNNLTYLPDSFKCTVTLQIQEWDQNNHSLPTLSETLSVRYTPFTYTTYLDKAAFLFKNAYRYTVTVTNVSITGATYTFPSNTLPVNVYLDADIQLQRYYDFTLTAQTGIATTDILNNPVDMDCDSRPDQLVVSWSPIQGAEQYDLEWTFVNDYANTSTLGTFESPNNL